jgi:hypothetical protein
MEQNIFGFNIEWDYKAVSLLIFLLAVPNLLGMINLNTGLGFQLHFFQIAIFFAALIYGPVGGALSGALGSVYSAVAMHNPYIVIGNIILGFFVGIFIRYGFKIIVAVLLAFAIQLPWLVLSDHYFAQIPFAVIGMLVCALLVSNIAWATVTQYSARHLRS